MVCLRQTSRSKIALPPEGPGGNSDPVHVVCHSATNLRTWQERFNQGENWCKTDVMICDVERKIIPHIKDDINE